MRTTFLAIFLALVATCARADVIDNVITNLPDGWNDNETGTIIMPETASTEAVLQRVLRDWLFPGFGEITNFTVLKTRQVAIPVGHFPGAHVYSYTAVLVQASQGGKVQRAVVLLRCFDVYTSRAWLSTVFDARYFEAKPSA